MLEKPLELSFTVTDNQSEGRRGDAFLGLSTLEKPLELSSHRDWQPERGVGLESTPPGRCVPGHGNARKSPWSLALTVTDNQSEGRRGGLYPARVMCPWAWQRSKSPWSLALILTDNQSEGRQGGLYPARVMCPWAWQRSKSPWSLALTVTDNQSEGRRVDFNPPEWCVPGPGNARKAPGA